MLLQASEMGYFKSNTIEDFDKFTTEDTIGEHGLELNAGNTATYSFRKKNANSLSGARSRKLVIKAYTETALPKVFNYQSELVAIITYTYTDEESSDVYGTHVVNLTRRGTKSTSRENIRKATYILDLPAEDLNEMSITLKNNTDNTTVIINSIGLYRSKDVSGAQAAENLEFGIPLLAVDAYQNGCLLYFMGVDAPLRLEYSSDPDTHEFNGVVVGEGLFIEFSRKNSPLPEAQ